MNVQKKARNKKHVTGGHNIVVDGRAGASTSHPQPALPPQYTHQCILNARFPTFRLVFMDQRTNGPTNRRTDKATLACPQLKYLTPRLPCVTKRLRLARIVYLFSFFSCCSLKLFFRFGEGFGDAVMFKFEM